ncbi:MAG: aminopeptidase P family protein [Chloroflexi bacterium]|nr:aminopeptidase P family protein [Chloroflexota bacterium]
MPGKVLDRLQRLRAGLAEKEIESMLVSQPENRFYLSGFSGSAGYLLVTPDRAVLATDFRYIEQAKAQAPDYEIFRAAGDIAGWLPEMARDLGIRALGFEAANVTFSLYQQLKDGIKEKDTGNRLVPLNGVVESLRVVKEPEEIAFMEQAARIADGAFEYAESFIQPGMTEREAAWEIEKAMRERGSQALPFDIIVASGPNAAMPHAQPSARRIGLGEPVVIDMGARHEGYACDLTRTICLGNQDDTFKRVYDVVLGAQLTAIAIVKDGMTGEQADSLARKVIEQAGYGEAFGHGTGHGVGLATHEPPRLAPKSADVLKKGMVFTIEPGVYLPGWGGVRIEDLVQMEEGRVRVLSGARKA